LYNSTSASLKRRLWMKGRAVNKLTAFLVWSTFSLCLNAQISLGPTVSSFGVLAGSTVTSSGPTVVTGNLGVSPGTAITGFTGIAPGGPGIVVGTIHSADAFAAQAQSELTAAYNAAAGAASTATKNGDLGGQTLFAGVYTASSSLGITGTVTLDAQGNPNAQFIFQIGSALTTATSSVVRLINGAQPGNVFGRSELRRLWEPVLRFPGIYWPWHPSRWALAQLFKEGLWLAPAPSHC
jgi:hypothetical protein